MGLIIHQLFERYDVTWIKITSILFFFIFLDDKLIK
jgi:hypothetical protein